MSTPQRSKCVVEALSVLINQQPFFAAYLFDQMQIKENKTAEQSMSNPTACTDGKTITVNPDWFGKLSVKERVFVMAHEVMHGIYQHMQRGKLYQDRGFGPDLKTYSHSRMNKATDYIINAALTDAGVGEMPMGGLYHPKFKATDLADEVYLQIPEDEDEDSGHGKDGPGTGKGFDDHKDPAPGTPPPNESEVKRALKSAANAAKSQGKMPASLERLVDELIEPAVNWKELLKQNLEAGIGRDSVSWNKPSRRRLAMSPSVVMPGPVGYRSGQVSAVLDTSGSISEQETQLFLSEVAGILSLGKPEACRVIWCDSKVAGVDEVNEPSELLGLTAKGGGGTDMQAGLKYAEEHYGEHDHTVVVLTDMYTHFDNENPIGCKVIWVSTTKEMEAPYGTTIYANMELEQ